MRIVLIFLLFSFSLFGSVGKIIFLKGDVFVLRDNVQKPARAGMPLEENDTVITRKSSKSRILFADKSAISIGSNSEFAIKSYLFDDGAGKKVKADFGIKKGVFRMITGKIAKAAPEKFKVETRTATIGIRGTIFSGQISEKEEHIFCEKGTIYVAARGVSHDVKAGYSTSIPRGKPPTRPKKFKQGDLNKIHQQTGTWKGKQCKPQFN